MSEPGAAVLEESGRREPRHPVAVVVVATVIAGILYSALSTGSAGRCGGGEDGFAQCVQVTFSPAVPAQLAIAVAGLVAVILVVRRRARGGAVRPVMLRGVLAVVGIAVLFVALQFPGWYFGAVTQWTPGEPLELPFFVSARISNPAS